VQDGANIVVYAGLAIGLVYGAVGLLSGFCLVSGLRGWWAEGDSRLVRTYGLALGVAIAATQLLAARQVVDLGKSIYLQPSFSAPLMFFGGLLFGYGMVMSNGCGSRALVLLGSGNLRSFVVVIVLGETLRNEPLNSTPGLGFLRGTGSTLTSYVFDNSPAGEGKAEDKAYAAAFVLLLFVLLLNIVVGRISRRQAHSSGFEAGGGRP